MGTKTIGERIRERRIELGLSQDDLAKKIGYASRSSINKFELSRDMRLNKVEMMAKALECTPEFLMGWDEDDTIAQEDNEMLNTFHNLSPENRQLVMNLIRSLAK